MRERESKTLPDWNIPPNPNGRIWKENPRFHDDDLRKIINNLIIINGE